MKIFFPSRTAQRAFASTNGKRIDQGVEAGKRRWAFELKTSKNTK